VSWPGRVRVRIAAGRQDEKQRLTLTDGHQGTTTPAS